jgi:CMP-N,N'-diacetyllegionaminic acid synthase
MNHAIILARGGSKGIKNKNLIKINNKPLIYWSIKACLQTKSINKVWVSSDSKKILMIAKKLGASTILRPKKLSTDYSSSESGWLHSLNEIKKNFKVKFFVALQATSPIRGKNDIQNALRLIKKKNCDSLFTSTPLDTHYTWRVDKNKIKPNYNIKTIRKRRQNIKEKIIENGSFYIFLANKFQQHKKRLFGKIINYNQNKYKSFEIDNKEDIIIIESILKNYSKKLNLVK